MKTLIRGTGTSMLAVILALAACSGDEKTGPSKFGDSSYMRADFSGAYTGTLNATGWGLDVPTGQRYEFARAAVDIESFEWTDLIDSIEPTEVLYMHALELTVVNDESEYGHTVFINVVNPEVGSYSGDDLCGYMESSIFGDCRVEAGFASADGAAELSAFLTEGTLTITSLTDDRVAGTFELSGSIIVDDESKPAGVVHIRNGRYDLVIGDAEDLFEVPDTGSAR